MTLPASGEANLLEFLQPRSLRRPQSFSQFQLSHRPRLGGSPFLRQGRSRESQAYLGKNFKVRGNEDHLTPHLPENGGGVMNERATGERWPSRLRSRKRCLTPLHNVIVKRQLFERLIPCILALKPWISDQQNNRD
jgi:hypothetical protein